MGALGVILAWTVGIGVVIIVPLAILAACRVSSENDYVDESVLQCTDMSAQINERKELPEDESRTEKLPKDEAIMKTTMTEVGTYVQDYLDEGKK